MKKYCDVCGKPSGMYPLCNACFKLRDEGKVIKCEECGKWHLIDKACEECGAWYKQAKTATEKKENKNSYVEDDDYQSNCLICGNEAYGYLFCKECYNKYKDKTILLKVTNCDKIELMQTLDQHEDGLIYKCADGHKVRSRAEVLIDDWLYYHGYAHAYEKALAVDADKDHDLHPDFYLTKEDIYIEHWGYENKKDYQSQKNYKIEKYKDLGVTVICTTEKDLSDISGTLERKLKFYKKGIVNE